MPFPLNLPAGLRTRLRLCRFFLPLSRSFLFHTPACFPSRANETWIHSPFSPTLGPLHHTILANANHDIRLSAYADVALTSFSEQWKLLWPPIPSRSPRPMAPVICCSVVPSVSPVGLAPRRERGHTARDTSSPSPSPSSLSYLRPGLERGRRPPPRIEMSLLILRAHEMSASPPFYELRKSIKGGDVFDLEPSSPSSFLFTSSRLSRLSSLSQDRSPPFD
jgi:hypothetical protein